jgi:flagellar biosynthesis protein FlgN
MQALGNNLAQSLGEELGAANALLQLLKQEQAHLIDANVDELAKITEEKAKIVARMTELAQNRHRTLAAAGFEASEAGMQKWAKSRTALPAASKSWNELLGIAKEAKELNRINGMLIGQHAARNQIALNILQGNPQGGTMYGPDGQSTSKSSSRKLVVG